MILEVFLVIILGLVLATLGTIGTIAVILKGINP